MTSRDSSCRNLDYIYTSLPDFVVSFHLFFWSILRNRASQVVKHPPANAEDAGDVSLTLELGRPHGGRNGHPLQYFCLGNPTDRGAWRATIELQRVGRAWATEHIKRLNIQMEMVRPYMITSLWPKIFVASNLGSQTRLSATIRPEQSGLDQWWSVPPIFAPDSELSRTLWGSWMQKPFCVPVSCLWEIGFIQPPWPSVSSKGHVHTVATQGRRGCRDMGEAAKKQ